MSKFNDVLNIFNENVTMGNSIVVNDIVLIPVLKVNLNYLSLDKNEEAKENANANINASPICFIKVVDSEVSIVNLEEKTDMLDKIPLLLDSISKTIGISSIFKNQN